MALTSGAPRMAGPGTKTNNIWLKKWGRMPKSKRPPLPLYLRKLLIYYPKNLHALQPFTLQVFKSPIYKNSPQFTQKFKRMCKTIINRYKRIFFRHLDIDTAYKGPLIDRLFGSIQSLRIDCHGSRQQRSRLLLEKLMKNNKQIKIIDVSGDPLCPKYIVKQIRCQRMISSMSVSGCPLATAQEMKRIYFNRSSKLDDFNVMGSLYEVQQGDAEEFLRKWEMTCAVLAAKKLRFDSQTPGEFDVNLIPFSELRKRNIQFDIRAVHSIDNLEISEANAQAFQDLEFLGVNTKREWLSLTSKWDIVQEQHLNLQKSSKNLLFLSLHEMSDFIDLTSLLHACRNITTLDLILSEINTVNIDFTALQDLQNLKNVFIQLHSYHIPPYGLIENLALCAQKHQKIETLVLEFFSGILFPDITCLKAVLEACAPTLKTFYLQFSLITGYHAAIQTVYESLDLLENLETLGILVTGQSFRMAEFEGAFQVHANSVQNLLNSKPKLENFYFVASDIDIKKVNINFGGTENLRKLSFLFSGRECDSTLVENIIELKDITHLEIGFTGQDCREWCDLIKSLKHLKHLEMLRFKEVPLRDSECDILQELKDLVNRHAKLELMLFHKKGEFEVLLCTRDYYIKEVDISFWSDYIDTPTLLPNKVYFS